MDLTFLGYGLVAAGGLAQLVTSAAVAWRVRARRPAPLPTDLPAVTLVRPVCGLENFLEEALESGFRLTYPRLETLFCVDDEMDPVVPVVRRLMAAHPRVRARLLVGRDRISSNPKLNNVVKGWNAATSDWIILSDSNAILPADYVERLLSCRRPTVGVVSTAAVISRPEGFAADFECAFMNTYQARWVLFSDMIGFGFALGKTLMWRRQTLDALGGIEALGREAAEDVASTKVLRGSPLRPVLAPRPVEQPVGRRRFADVWARQVRWARLRRAGLRSSYWPEILSGGLVPIGIAAALAANGALGWAAFGVYVALWYTVEIVLAAIAGWALSWRTPAALVLRDLLVPVVWVAGWIGNTFEWRGNVMSVREPSPGPMLRDGNRQ